MITGENYLITYHRMNGKSLIAMYMDEVNGNHLLENRSGIFEITSRAIKSGDISLELIE